MFKIGKNRLTFTGICIGMCPWRRSHGIGHDSANIRGGEVAFPHTHALAVQMTYGRRWCDCQCVVCPARHRRPVQVCTCVGGCVVREAGILPGNALPYAPATWAHLHSGKELMPAREPCKP